MIATLNSEWMGASADAFKGDRNNMAVLSQAVLDALRIRHNTALLARREELPEAASSLFSDRELASVTNAHVSLRELSDLLDTIASLQSIIASLHKYAPVNADESNAKRTLT